VAVVTREKETRPDNSRPLKVAIVSPYDFAYPGGVTSHVSSLDERLRALGHQTTIIAPSSKSPDALGQPNLVPLGRPVPLPLNGSIARITIALNLGKKVKSLLSRERFDVVHIHEPLVPSLPVTFLRLCNSAALVGTFHTYAKPRRWYPASQFILRGRIEKWAARLDARIAVSPPARDFVSKYLPGTYTVIPNGVSIDRFTKPADPPEGLVDGKLNILFVGRMEKRKGFPHLLRAYAQAKWQLPESRLVVVGPDQIDKESARVIGERGLRDIHMAGYLSEEDLASHYRVADLFVSPATGAESQGIVLLEAMAAGAPVMASRIPGYESVVTDGVDGVLIDPRNETTFSEALISLLKDKPRRDRLARTGRENVERYRWEQVTSEILDVYRGAMASRIRKAV
jgi:phosphatidylinositol alpha-mannosyltransferase